MSHPTDRPDHYEQDPDPRYSGKQYSGQYSDQQYSGQQYSGQYGSGQQDFGQYSSQQYPGHQYSSQQYPGRQTQQFQRRQNPWQRARRNTTPVVLGLIVACVAIYLGQQILPRITFELALVPQLVPFQPWRMLTSGFIHFGLFHIGMNMLVLFMLGRPAEQALGSGRFAVLYVASLLGGSTMAILLSGNQLSLIGGASGAIFGLFGALIVMQRYGFISGGNLMFYLVLNLVIGFAIPGISWQSHIGGVLIGAGVAWSFMRERRRQISTRTMCVEVGAIMGLLAVVVVAKYLWLGGIG